MDDRVYWIWIQQAFKAGSRMPAKIAGQYAGGLREFCEGGPKLWNCRRDLKDSEAVALRDFSLSQAQARLEYAEKVGWQVLTPGCGKYPRLLANIPNPPAVLYVKGTLPDVDRMTSVAVVGARKALPASADAARHFGYQLAAGGACVVSGGARGVDAGALSGALQIPGARMISVLPVSLDSSYVLENAKLRASICEYGGALVTEYFSQHYPQYGTFQVRNRLITGLSRGVVIIQAAARSGSLIYASHALEQDRDVYVYPGPEGQPEFAGSRGLLVDGAKAVTCGEDVLEEYDRKGRPVPAKRQQVAEMLDGLVPAPAGRKAEPARVLMDSGADANLPSEANLPLEANRPSDANLPPEAPKVLAALGREPLSVAELAERTGLSASALLGLLTELELEGLAVSHPGKRYSRGL